MRVDAVRNFAKRRGRYRRCGIVRGSRAACRPVTDEKALIKSAEIRERLGIGRNISLYECDAVDSPMLIGFWNPGVSDV